MEETAEMVSHGIFSCRVPYSGNKQGSVETNVAIEMKNGKYGLVWTELYSPDYRCRLLGYRYDSINFINEDNNLLVACQTGKVGLYALEVQNDNSETVVIKALLP